MNCEGQDLLFFGEPLDRFGDAPALILESGETVVYADLAERASSNLKLPVLTKRVSAIAQKQPDQVAKLLRGWIRDSES